MYIVKIVSICKTYKETMKCLSLEEAQMYADQINAEGEATATVVAPK